ncbi:vacuolar protein sorting-associated protein 51 homolog [Sycon ciliatum]|uniref:vacuolar protein sorting-associated protein 51 homolog n=1 Tax=Sycon ciliatum TaxID=27933 RepID=UPI0020AD79D6|eukprot:scpid36475/ scgid10099/ Protein fat-free homolog
MAEGEEPPKRKRRNLLKLYYGVSENQSEANIDPTDINSPHFQSAAYMEQLLQSKSLAELMDKEDEMHQQIKVLDRDMQTLVYDNYNKFISATDMIRKMKSDFKKMEDEMDRLSSNMQQIQVVSDTINKSLDGQRQELGKLAGVHSLLKKLQFLFELPSRLKKCMTMDADGQAVRYYVKARHVLKEYEHMPSFQIIQRDCLQIVDQLREKLRGMLRSTSSQPQKLAECVELLLELDEPAEELCDEYIKQASHQISLDLKKLSQLGGDGDSGAGEAEERVRLASDVLEFADLGCNSVLSDVALLIANFTDLFLRRSTDEQGVAHRIKRVAQPRLIGFIKATLKEFFQIVKRRFESEVPEGSDQFLVRALDRFHRKLLSVHKLMPVAQIDELAAEMVSSTTVLRVTFFSDKLRDQFAAYLADARQAIATQSMVPSGAGAQAGENTSQSAPLTALFQEVSGKITEEFKATINSLKVYVSPEVVFASQPRFRVPFCRQQIRQGLVVKHLYHIVDTAADMCKVTTSRSTPPPPVLLLLLSRLCLEMKDSVIGYLVSLADEAFPASERSSGATPIADLCKYAGTTAQELLDHFVSVQGLSISQMIRKSVETRDWLSTLEPRTVRPVMKRVVEDVSILDHHVGQLFEEGTRRGDHSSDDSRASRRRNIPTGTRAWNYAPNAFDTNLMSNIQKLFSERIEIFGSVEFNKVSVVTGIVKIALKTFLECVRLRTFGKYGLQQVQVDTHYLQIYLWRFVSDENLVKVLVDEIVSSTVQRCTDPVVMEPSVIDVICSQN